MFFCCPQTIVDSASQEAIPVKISKSDPYLDFFTANEMLRVADCLDDQKTINVFIKQGKELFKTGKTMKDVSATIQKTRLANQSQLRDTKKSLTDCQREIDRTKNEIEIKASYLKKASKDKEELLKTKKELLKYDGSKEFGSSFFIQKISESAMEKLGGEEPTEFKALLR